LARCHWGRGIATGAVRLLLVQARSQPLLQVVCSSVLTSNPASRRVLEKNGFQVTATTTACSAFYPRFAGRQVWHLSRRLFDP
jgi:RimJ/RimL family protein N-acetyltransferase